MGEKEIVKKAFRKEKPETNLMNYGKIPPQVKELEEAVLGAIMIEANAIEEISTQFFPEMFYVDAHQRIARAIIILRNRRMPIDLLTVTEQLKKNGDLDAAGGAYYVAQLTNKVGSAANIYTHNQLIFEKWILRKLISWSSTIIQEAYEDTSDVIDMYHRAEGEWRSLQSTIFTGQIPSLDTQVDEAVRLIERQQDGKGAGVPSKLRAINRHLGGWQKQTVNVIGARPGMGKTALMVSEVYYAIKNGHRVYVFCIEPTMKQFYARMLSHISNIPWNRAKTRDFKEGEQKKWDDAIAELKTYRHLLTVDFTPGIILDDMLAKCAKIKHEKGLDAVWIDYLQLMSVANPKGMNRDAQVGEISKGIKTMSKKLDLAVIALASLSRKSEGKADKEPDLTDLRESGNIESDADTVTFLMRPEYYFKKDANGNTIYNGDEEQFKNICQVINAKNREDKTFKDDTRCYLGTSTVVDIEESEEIAFKGTALLPMHEAMKLDPTNTGSDEDLPF